MQSKLKLKLRQQMKFTGTKWSNRRPKRWTVQKENRRKKKEIQFQVISLMPRALENKSCLGEAKIWIFFSKTKLTCEQYEKKKFFLPTQFFWEMLRLKVGKKIYNFFNQSNSNICNEKNHCIKRKNSIFDLVVAPALFDLYLSWCLAFI